MKLDINYWVDKRRKEIADGLESLQEAAPGPVELHSIIRVAHGDATRLGHFLSSWTTLESQPNIRWAYCSHCDDDITVDLASKVIKGTASVLRCKG